MPDAAKILDLPLSRIHRWVGGYALPDREERRFSVGTLAVEEEGRDRHSNFPTLIEVFTIAQLRAFGVSATSVRRARDELSKRFGTPYPFASEGVLANGRQVLKELGDQVYLELGTNGQQAFEQIVSPLCKRVDFDAATRMAQRFFPRDGDHNIVVDPKQAFGRPVITGTNITTETAAALMKAGESVEDIADDYSLTLAQIESAVRFETRRAA